jgi:hypothetical protein
MRISLEARTYVKALAAVHKCTATDILDILILGRLPDGTKIDPDSIRSLGMAVNRWKDLETRKTSEHAA